MEGLTSLDDIERKAKNISEEIDALLVIWNVDPKAINAVILRDAIKQIMSTIYSFTMIISRLQKTVSSLSGLELTTIELTIDVAEKEIRNLFNTTQQLLPQVPRREFILGFLQVIQGIDSIINRKDE
jgi:DNA-directed RNA polymerase specialized sigma54-like protein